MDSKIKDSNNLKMKLLVNGFREFNSEIYYQIFKQHYSPEILKEVLAAGVEGLIILNMAGGSEATFDFLQDWHHLLRCRIIDFERRSMEPLRHLAGLEYLSYDGDTRSEIMADWFPNLRRVDIIAARCTRTFLKKESVEYAVFHELKVHRARVDIFLPQLETLALFSSNIESMDEFGNSQKLKKVRLASCRKFRDSRSFELFPDIEEIEIQDAHCVESFEVFNELENLKKLRIEGPPRDFKTFSFRPDLNVIVQR